MGITQIIFWLLTILTISSALMVIFSKNPIYSILWLIVTFFGISGHYIMLNAQFLAIVNIIVYAGAIMVLFLFVVMLMNLNQPTLTLKKKWLQIAGVISGGSLMLVLVAALKNTAAVKQDVLLHTGDIGLIENLGRELFTNFVLPFELSSVLFLSAMVGAVLIGKREPGEQQ